MRKGIISLICFLFLHANTSFAVKPSLFANFPNKHALNAWVDSIFATLTPEEQIGQLFMVTADVSFSKSNVEKLTSYIQKQKIGGLLFAKSTIESQARLTNQLQAQARLPLFISLDGEWGLSMRIDNTLRFPKNIALGAIKNSRQIFDYGREVARQCKLMGIHINFAPVLDINNNPNNPVINIRSFGENRERVAEAATAYADGLESGGIISVGKHFPGHGDTSVDSHFGLPTLNLSLKRIDSLELYPFKKYINSGYAGMMVGHLFLPAFDSDTIPASLSSSVINDLLKNELGFEGLIFTDALVMKAIGVKGKSVAIRALQAGVDILLNPANVEAEYDSVRVAVNRGEISAKSIEARCKKILAYKYISGLNHYQPIDLNSLANQLNSREGEVLNRKLVETSLTLLKNSANIIPIKNLDNERIAVLSLGDKSGAFQSTTKLYSNTTFFSINESTSAEQISQISKSLNGFSLILVGVFNEKPDLIEKTKQVIAALSNTQRLITTFFISPYKSGNYKPLINQSQGVLMAYEPTVPVQQKAVQLLFGGIQASGKLPVTVDSLFISGAGLPTDACRLAYDFPESVGVDSRKLSLIDSLVERGIKAQAMPGCQVLVAKSGTVIYSKGFGTFDYTNAHAVTPFDVYDLASMTKATATLPALMMLYDQKKFTLRDRFESFIPALRKTDCGHIQVKEALFHQSGLPPFIPFYHMLFDPASYEGNLINSTKSAKYPIQIDENAFVPKGLKFLPEFVSETETPTHRVKVADNFYLNPKFYDSMMEKLLKTKLGSKQKCVYSDLNFMLLRMMIENISQIRIDTFIQQNLFSKLGAYSTGYLPLERMDKSQIAPTENDQFFRNQLLIGHVDDELAALSGGVDGNAGLFSNANDIAKYCQMLLNGGEYGGESFISKETVKLFINSKSVDSRRGLGFDKPNPIKPSQGPTSDSAPLTTVGHTGFTGTSFWIDPENELIYIFLSNRVYPNRANKKLVEMNLRTQIQDVIYQAITQNRK